MYLHLSLNAKEYEIFIFSVVLFKPDRSQKRRKLLKESQNKIKTFKDIVSHFLFIKGGKNNE